MGITPKTLERANPSLQTSPERNITSISNTSSPNSNGVESPSTPKAISISETSGCPTTFIQADPYSFKQVVQLLTGSPETTTKQAAKPTSPVKTTKPKKPGFKLHERRNNLKNLKIVHALALNSVLSPSQSKILSPSVLDLHKLVLSPVTPLNPESIDRASEKVIAEEAFYLLASPVTPPIGPEPQLLPLFPVTSPRVSGT